MKEGSCVINTSLAELLDYSSTEGATVSFVLIYLFVCLFLRLFTDFGSWQVVLLSMLDIACCSFGSPWKYGLLQK